MPLLSNDHYRVGRSKTGLGLFAVKPIKKGAKIIRYFGPLLDAHNKKHDGIENKYLFELNKRWTIDGSKRWNVARYVNHSCRPNAEPIEISRDHVAAPMNTRCCKDPSPSGNVSGPSLSVQRSRSPAAANDSLRPTGAARG